MQEPLCQTTLFMIMYGTVASTFWMLVEGCYLATRLSTFGMRSEGSLPLFMFAGYGRQLIGIIPGAVIPTRGCCRFSPPIFGHFPNSLSIL